MSVIPLAVSNCCSYIFLLYHSQISYLNTAEKLVINWHMMLKNHPISRSMTKETGCQHWRHYMKTINFFGTEGSWYFDNLYQQVFKLISSQQVIVFFNVLFFQGIVHHILQSKCHLYPPINNMGRNRRVILRNLLSYISCFISEIKGLICLLYYSV